MAEMGTARRRAGGDANAGDGAPDGAPGLHPPPHGVGSRIRAALRQAGALAPSFPAVRRKLGTGRALRLVASELAFDLRHRTDTSFEADGASASGRHEACNPLIFTELLRRTPVATGTAVFLDYGAGKGRALLLAAGHGFGRVIGVERSPALCAVAERNVAAGRVQHGDVAVEIHQADAVDFEVPAEVTVVFFFNPFGADVMRAVRDRLVDSLAVAPRDLHIVYLNPSHAELFAEAGFLVLHDAGSDGVVLRSPDR